MKHTLITIDNRIKVILVKAALVAALLVVIFAMWFADYRSKKASQIELKSRYTFSIRIDENGGVIADDFDGDGSSTVKEQNGYGNVTLTKIANIWVTEFTSQFTQKYISHSKSLKKVSINEPQIINSSSNTVLVSFSATKSDSTTEFFSSWDGVTNNGVMEFEWVVSFDIDNHSDGTATVYIKDIQTPEDYGLSQKGVNESVGKTEVATSEATNELTGYEIKNSTLSVTYNNGAKYITVPVDYETLPMALDSTTKLQEGSYIIDAYKTAFLCGGVNSGDNKAPISIIYSDDNGVNWISSEVSQIYDANYLYVNFFDNNNGIIAAAYSKNSGQEMSRIFITHDGGENWTIMGNGPTTDIVKGISFIDESIGFYCYDYKDGMESNLYMTRDGGKTYSMVILEAQELDSSASGAAKLSWNDVYKEALVPIRDDKGVLTIYLTQGNDGTYNNGKTAAKYQSTDNGVTWKYIGQPEITS